MRSACMGVFLGSMYYQIDDGDAVSRILLFALVYLYLSIFLAEMLPGLFLQPMLSVYLSIHLSICLLFVNSC